MDGIKEKICSVIEIDRLTGRFSNGKLAKSAIKSIIFNQLIKK
jgi:hypothetical protein